ncbi:MAG: type IV pilin protein [Gemmatimonadota bacterium]
MAHGEGGFTLIEVLVVLLIVAILAGVALPKVSATREKAYVAAMKSDLRNLGAAQAAYFARNDTFAASLPSGEYNTSEGVTVVIDSATATGWGAHASHQATTITCTASDSASGTQPPTCGN